MTAPAGPLARVREGWGDNPPDWILGLARACAETSQNHVAKRLGRSGSLVSQVLANRYAGGLDAVEDLYRGVFESSAVACPGLGEITTDKCRMWRGRASAPRPTNTLRVLMFRACNGCARHKGGDHEQT